MGYFFLTFLLLFPYFRKTGKDRKRSKKERAREKSGAPGTARDRGCSVSAQVAPSAPGVWAARCVCRDMSECLWISRRSMAAGLGQLPLGGQSGFSFVLFLLFLLFSYFSLLLTEIKMVHIQGSMHNTNRHAPPIRFKSGGDDETPAHRPPGTPHVTDPGNHRHHQAGQQAPHQRDGHR